MVGHTLYGDVDIGMSNIDITYSRYQAVDYSAWVRYALSNNLDMEGLIKRKFEDVGMILLLIG